MRCKATNQNGEPCRQRLNVDPETGYCRAHDPALTDALRSQSQRGGKAATRAKRIARLREAAATAPPAPKTIDDSVEWLSWAIRQVATGEMDARTGHEIAFIAKAFREAVEKRDMENEIKALRAEMDALRRATPKLKAL